MKILVMMDSFKESLTSSEAGEAVKEGILRVHKDADVTVKCLADGGEGTTNAILQSMEYQEERVSVFDPIGRRIAVSYGITKDGTAVMEMAASSGLGLLSRSEQNPLYTSTYGFGEMIADAVQKGVRKFILGIGGSATNDSGMGMLAALGYRFWTQMHQEITLDPQNFDLHLMSEVAYITNDSVLPELQDCQFMVACDVTNPLCGELGATAVFGPQKGLPQEQIAKVDAMVEHFARVILHRNLQYLTYPGAGAAGGLGFALLTMLSAELKSGIDIILDAATKPEDFDVDIFITGEGKLDGQSAMGKGPVGIVKHCLKVTDKKPLILAFAGSVTKDAKVLNEVGIDGYFPIVRGVTSLEEALDSNNAKDNIADTVEQIFRILPVQKRKDRVT